jgi:two-component system sensor histidine kinase KdpD
VAAVVTVAGVTGALKLLGNHINSATVALALLLVVVFLAVEFGSRAAITASLIAVVCFNFFFLPPVGTFDVASADNWIALGVFLVTAVTVGQLSARARRRAEEAETARLEVEHLYHQLQDSFEQASRAKALEQSERMKSALLDAVTHDLRTPLTSIKASVTTLLNQPAGQSTLDDASRREMLEVINEEADRLDRFIEDLMELARIEAGEMHLQKHWGSIEEIIAAALKRAAPLTRKHTVDVVIEKELPAVRVDGRAVAEVIYNLVENAAKFSPPGTQIHVEARSGNDDTVTLAVCDQGPGIPKELRERVFDKFFRVMRDGQSSGRPANTGMGLAIARGIVEAHEGRVWVDDKNSSGTRIVVVLPTGDRDEQTRALTA